jgi:hypothetical protein
MKPQFIAPADPGKHNADMEETIARVKGSGRYNAATHKAWYEKNAEKKRAYARDYYAQHKAEVLAKASARHHANPDVALAKNRKYTYGIDTAAIAALLVKQGGKCGICEMEFGSARKGTKPHVDHDHNTGRVRGLLCQKCNLALAVVEKVGFIDRAYKYLGVA